MEDQLAKFFAGEANDNEKREVLEWRNQSYENAENFLLSKASWLESGVNADSNEDLLSQIIEPSEAKVVGWPAYLKYAAAVILLGMIASLWYFNNDNTEVNHLVFSGTYQVLDDGTIVSMKKGSSLEVLEFSDKFRRVRVSGKAFFEVERDENRPFEVVTNDATVRVLGTSFQVIGENDFTEVSVESGLVSFAKNNSRNGMSLNLEKGEMGMITKNNQGIVKRKILDKNFLAWKSGVISFEGMKAFDVIKTINDVYNVTISMNEELFNCKLTAQFNQKTLDEVLQILSLTFDWNYEIIDNKVIISGEGC